MNLEMAAALGLDVITGVRADSLVTGGEACEAIGGITSQEERATLKAHIITIS